MIFLILLEELSTLEKTNPKTLKHFLMLRAPNAGNSASRSLVSQSHCPPIFSLPSSFLLYISLDSKSVCSPKILVRMLDKLTSENLLRCVSVFSTLLLCQSSKLYVTHFIENSSPSLAEIMRRNIQRFRMIISNPLAVESKWVTYLHPVQNPCCQLSAWMSR